MNDNPPERVDVPTSDAQNDSVTHAALAPFASAWVDSKNGKLPWRSAKVAMLIGLPAIAALAAVGTWWGVEHIENELEDRTRAALEAEGVELAGIDVEFDYRDGIVTGVLPAGIDPDDLKAAIGDGLLRTIDIDVSATELTNPSPAAAPTASPTAAPTATPTPPAEPQVVEFGVTVELIEGQIVLQGTVASVDAHDVLHDAALHAVGEANTEDRLAVGALDPPVADVDARIARLATFVATLAGADAAVLTLDSESLTVDVAVGTKVTGDLFLGLGTTAPFPVTVNLTVHNEQLERELAALQDALDALADDVDADVVFTASAATFGSEATTTLDRVAATIAQHPSAMVEVAAHTGGSGDAKTNQKLSDARAAVIAAYLELAGIDRDRIISRGAGDTEPIADNNTDAGRAANQRITFTALEPT